MANFGTRKGHVSPTQLFLLNVIVHSIALFLSYGFYFGSNNSISSLNIEIYMILGTICWLLLLKLSKITNIKKFMKKWTLDLYSKWINCFGIIRILVFVFFFISIFWNDYLRLVVCSYLSALSIVQYSESQHPALQYSSESIVTTGADRNHKDESQVGSDSTVYPISSNENILRQRRNIAPPPVPPNYSKSTIRMKYPEPQVHLFVSLLIASRHQHLLQCIKYNIQKSQNLIIPHLL